MIAINVYVSAASSEWQRVASVVERLEVSKLISVPFRWWVDAAEWTGNDTRLDPQERARVARSVFEAIDAADAFLFLAPSPGHVTRTGWAELGYALGLERAIEIVCAGDYQQAVCTAMADHNYRTDDEAIARLRRLVGEQ